MTYFESLNFVYQLVFERFDLPVWVWSILAAILSVVLLHWLWGLAWNAQWGMFRRPGVAAFSIVMAIVVLISALTWLAAGRAGDWLDQQRTELARQITDSGALNRRIFRDAREQLSKTKGTDENAMTLNGPGDLEILAQAAAQHVRCPLTQTGPLGRGAPCRVREPVAVAQEVVRAIPAATFPLRVTPDNPWTKAAITAQIQEALSYAEPRLQAGMTELRNLTAVLFWIALGLLVLIVPIAAVSDIRVHPQV